MAAAKIAVVVQSVEACWGPEGSLVDDTPRTGLETDRHPVLFEEHEPLLQNFVARLVVREEVVDAIQGPGLHSPEMQAGVRISRAVKGIRAH
jgi:hypothetical protein